MDDFYYFIDKFMNKEYEFKDLDNKGEYYQSYIGELNKVNVKQLNYDEIVNLINNSKLKDTYLSKLKDFHYDLVYNSHIHGMSHIIRCSIYLLIICILENISNDEFKILIDCILYHDVGRINDIDDDIHGYRSTTKIEFLKSIYDTIDYNLICSVIEAHCLDDDVYGDIASKYNVIDVYRGIRYLSIIKDTDALDRVREYPYIDVSFLRTNSSKQLIDLTYKLFDSYNINLDKR